MHAAVLSAGNGIKIADVEVSTRSSGRIIPDLVHQAGTWRHALFDQEPAFRQSE